MFKLSTSFQTRLDRQRTEDESRDNIIRFLKKDQLAAISHKLEQTPYRPPQKDEMDITRRRERMTDALDMLQDEDVWYPPPPDLEREREREQEMLRKVVQDSPEIRELRVKLQAAEMNRQRYHQLQEKQIKAMEDSARDSEFHKMMEERLQKAAIEDQERFSKFQKDRVDIKMAMKEQLHQKEVLKERAWEQKVEEQKEMNKVIAKLNADRQAEEDMRRKKQAETRDYISDYLKKREKEKELQAKRLKEEEAANLRFQALQDQRLAEKAAKEREKREQEEKIQAILSADKERELREREEYEQMLNDLYFEEAEERYRKKAEEERIQREHTKANLKASSQYDFYVKEQRKLKEKAEKEAFHKQLMEQMAEEHKLDQMSAQKRRMKAEEFKRDIEKRWNEKQAMFQQEVEEAKEKRRREEEFQAKRKAVIEEERQKMLASQGKKLAPFLPKGTLETKDDFKFLRPTKREA